MPRPSRERLNPLALGDRLLLGLVLLAVAGLAGYFSLLPFLPAQWRRPGSGPLYILGITGVALLLLSMVFVAVARCGRGGAPPSDDNYRCIAQPVAGGGFSMGQFA